MIKINIDASTHPTHKISVGCFVLKKDDTTITKTFPIDAKDNHVAEFKTLITALEYCIEENYQHDLVFVYSDSKIVVTSYQKNYVKNDSFSSLLQNIRELSSYFSSLIIEWIPESQNKQADHYAKRALQKELKLSKKKS